MEKLVDIKIWPEPDPKVQPKITKFFEPVSRKRGSAAVCQSNSGLLELDLITAGMQYCVNPQHKYIRGLTA